MLNEIISLAEDFLSLVNKKLKDLQSLRVLFFLPVSLVSVMFQKIFHLQKRTADTWLATTSVASVAVGGAAAALCVLTGGVALPVLAPIIAFGAGTTGWFLSPFMDYIEEKLI